MTGQYASGRSGTRLNVADPSYGFRRGELQVLHFDTARMN